MSIGAVLRILYKPSQAQYKELLSTQLIVKTLQVFSLTFFIYSYQTEVR